MSADRQCVQGFLQGHGCDALPRVINHDNGIDPQKGAVGVPDLYGRSARSARSLKGNVALMRAFRRSPMEFLDVLVASGAGTTPVRMGPERVLLIDDATEVWELLTTHARRTGKGRGLVRARLLLGEGLLTSEGDAHLSQRRTLQPAFHPQRIADYAAHFADAARRRADRWSDGGDIDLIAEMSAMTLDAVGRALFGSDVRTPTPEITRALTDLLAGFRLAMAPGGRTLLRSPMPSPFGCGRPRTSSRRSSTTSSAGGGRMPVGHVRCWTCWPLTRTLPTGRCETR